MLYALIISNTLIGLATIFKFSHLPPQIPLFYSLPWGEDQLGEFWMILLLPALLNLFVFFNQWILHKFYPDNPFLEKVIYYFNFCIIITISAIYLKILFLIA